MKFSLKTSTPSDSYNLLALCSGTQQLFARHGFTSAVVRLAIFFVLLAVLSPLENSLKETTTSDES